MYPAIHIRHADAGDAPAIWALIHELAVFERAEKEHTVSVEELSQHISQGIFTAFVAEDSEEIKGMALAYPIYSTWKGPSPYLEDIIVKDASRQQGIGSALFDRILRHTLASGYARLGWQVLNWNEPAIAFYKKYQAVLDDEWITCRLFPEKITELVSSK